MDGYMFGLHSNAEMKKEQLLPINYPYYFFNKMYAIFFHKIILETLTHQLKFDSLIRKCLVGMQRAI
jgi:hypothetical protein